MKCKIGKTTVIVERGDITEAEVDAVVNAANAELWMGAGVAGALKRKGGVVIEEDAIRQGPVEIGEAVLTVAGNLAATHIIHAVTMGKDLKSDPDNIIAATRATPRTSPFLASPLSTRSSVFVVMTMRPSATAIRSVAALAETAERVSPA